MKSLRILCLHGYHGNAKILRDQMQPLVDGLEHSPEFVYADAPSLAAGDFGWWRAKYSTGSREFNVARYEGWSRTCDWVMSTFTKDGPFDGIFGFSQGATLAALLVGLRSPGGIVTERKPLSFDFAIVVGGFVATDPSLAMLYESTESYDMPSVHMIGQADAVVPSYRSQQLSSNFRAPLVIEHRGGHVIPSTPNICRQVSLFLRDRSLSRIEPLGASRAR